MSGSGFHVHGPHDHELEHAAQHAAQGHDDSAHHGIGGGSMTNQIALFTAVIATVGAIFSYMGGATQANAGLYKNNAAIRKTEASNQWNYYQAKSSKQNLSELAIDLAPESKKAFYTEEIARYKKEKADIKTEAEKLEKEAKDWDKKSDDEMHQHHRWAQAMTAVQIAISLAAITLLTKKKWLQYASYGVAGIGVALAGLAWFHI